MKSTIKKIKQQQTIQPTKITKNRITALLLALLLVTTVLSPIIPVKAQETTVESADISENNAEGGGHQTGTGGDGETSGGRPTGNDGSFETMLHYKYKDGLKMKEYERLYSVTLNGDGHFNVRSIDLHFPSSNSHEYRIFIFSDEPFTLKCNYFIKLDGKEEIHENYFSPDFGTTMRKFGDKYFYYYELTFGGLREDDEFISYNSPNKMTFTTSVGITDVNIKNAITATLDFTKDDYKEPNEASAVYNKSLDFASISADYKVKYTIEKNKDGHFEFITPDDAGIQFDWINRTDIDGAYVKFNLYGEYYDSFWSTTYTNTYVTLTCDRKNDLTFLCKQKDMLTQAKEKCNGSKGYGFVVNYIYVQAFANIDGTLCRSRIYKFDSDLVSDYGNADSEDDEWFPEITGGDSMPEGYEPDPENPDPEKTEPKPDKDDDTVVDTPIDNDPDVIINDDVTYLEAFKQFINVMKQGISYLGDFPVLVAKVFSFIPPIFILFIGIGFAVALLLRFLGR